MSDEKVNPNMPSFDGTAIDVEVLKKQIQESNFNAELKDLFWSPEVGDNNIRIFPYRHSTTPFIETYWHWFNDGKSGMICPKNTFGEDDCLICSMVSELYKSELEEDKKKASELRAKVRIYIPIISRDEIMKGEDPKIKFWGVSKTVYETIRKFCLDADYGDIANATAGNDLKVSHIKANATFRYGKTDILPKPIKTKVLDDMTLARKMYEDCINLFDIPKFKKPTENEIHERLTEYKNSLDVEERIEANDAVVEDAINSEKTDLQEKIKNLIQQQN